MKRINSILDSLALIGIGVFGVALSVFWEEIPNRDELPWLGDAALPVGVAVLVIGVAMFAAPTLLWWLGKVLPSPSAEEEAEKIKQAYLTGDLDQHSPNDAKKALCGALETKTGRFWQWGRGLDQPSQPSTRVERS